MGGSINTGVKAAKPPKPPIPPAPEEVSKIQFGSGQDLETIKRKTKGLSQLKITKKGR